MFQRDCRLRGGQAGVGWLFEGDEVARRLIGADPIPGLPLRHVVFADIHQLVALANLALGPVKDDPDPVLAIQKLNIIKYIALRWVRLGETEQLAVAVELRFPAGRQVSFDPRPVERRPRRQRTGGDHGAAARSESAAQPAVEALNITKAEVSRLERAEQVPVRIRAECAQSKQARPAGRPGP